MSERVTTQASDGFSLQIWMLGFFSKYGFLPVILVFLCIGFGLAEPLFMTGANALNIIEQASYLIVLATAQLFVLLTRGFDLSLGVVVSSVSVASAMVMVMVAPEGEGPVLLAVGAGILAGLALGALAGGINGVCVGFFDINPFVVTLGMQGIAFGVATTISGGFPVFGIPDALLDTFGQNAVWFGFLSPPIAVCLLVLVLSHLLLNRTVFGRSLYLLGANPRAAEVGGLPWRRYNMLAYVLCSSIAAIGAILMTARTGTGEPSTGGGLVLLSIAAAVAGGVSLRGGEGRVIHVVFGGLLVSILSVGMNLARIDSFLQQVVLGLVVVAAVFLDRLRLRIRV
ncbi:MAG: ABC transporter permease [Kiloniellales bacterium]